MVNEYVVILTDEQRDELVKRSEAVNIQDELEFLHNHLDQWLGIDYDARLEPVEK